MILQPKVSGRGVLQVRVFVASVALIVPLTKQKVILRDLLKATNGQ